MSYEYKVVIAGICAVVVIAVVSIAAGTYNSTQRREAFLQCVAANKVIAEKGTNTFPMHCDVR